VAVGFGVACPKPRPLKLEKKERRQKQAATAKDIRDQVWHDAESKCSRCRRRCLRQTTDPLRVGHVHHRIYRSQGGGDDIDNLDLVCGECHAKIHAGELESERSLGQRVRTA